jgi:hypothetical protein
VVRSVQGIAVSDVQLTDLSSDEHSSEVQRSLMERTVAGR